MSNEHRFRRLLSPPKGFNLRDLDLGGDALGYGIESSPGPRINTVLLLRFQKISRVMAVLQIQP
jgi:hypothetical protein